MKFYKERSLRNRRKVGMSFHGFLQSNLDLLYIIYEFRRHQVQRTLIDVGKVEKILPLDELFINELKNTIFRLIMPQIKIKKSPSE